MERMGEVVAVQGDLLVVQFCSPTDCEKCHGCMGGEAQRQLMVRGKAEIGDTAVVEMPTQKVLKASALAYAFPLLGMMAGLFLGATFFPQAQDAASIIGGVVGMGVPLAIVAVTERKRRADTSWQPTLLQVIPKKEKAVEAK